MTLGDDAKAHVTYRAGVAEFAVSGEGGAYAFHVIGMGEDAARRLVDAFNTILTEARQVDVAPIRLVAAE
jgi:hypothetical protein